MGINKVQYGNTVLIDLTDATATADKILQGYTAYGRDGSKLTGTATGGGSGDGYVWQDQDGYVHLSDEPGTQITVEPLSVTQNGTYTAPTGKAYSPVTVNVSGGGGGGLVYEEGTWTPSQDIAQPTINFANTHTTRPFHVLIVDADDTTAPPSDSAMWFFVTSFYDAMGLSPTASGSNQYYGRQQYMYNNSGTGTSSGAVIPSLTGSSNSMSNFLTVSAFMPYAGSTSRYFRSTRTYKWIAVWAPTT